MRTLLLTLGLLIAMPTYADSVLRITCADEGIGAEITVNGEFKGECPLDMKVKPGELELVVKKPLDAEFDLRFVKNMRIGDGVVQKVEAVLFIKHDKTLVKILVGFSPGGSADLLARTIASPVVKSLAKQKNAVHNRPGNGGMVAATEFRLTPPGDSALLLVAIRLAKSGVTPIASQGILDAFVPIAMASYGDNVYGFFAPAQTPRSDAVALEQAVVTALASPTVRQLPLSPPGITSAGSAGLIQALADSKK